MIPTPPGYSTGYVPRDWDADPFEGYAAPFDVQLIGRSEWDDRIEEMEQTKSRLSDMADAVGVPVKDQNGTPYCWINGPTRCMELARIAANQPHVSLSPASGGAIIKDFKAVGGWGMQAVKFISERGLVPSSLWPDNAIKREYDTPEADAERDKYRITEWYEMPTKRTHGSKAFDALMTALLLRIPVATAHNWWRHLVTAVDPVRLGRGRYGVRIDNSWGTRWKDNGRDVLAESKATPDEATAIRVVVAS